MDIVSVDGRCFYRSKIEAARKESRFVHGTDRVRSETEVEIDDPLKTEQESATQKTKMLIRLLQLNRNSKGINLIVKIYPQYILDSLMKETSKCLSFVLKMRV